MDKLFVDGRNLQNYPHSFSILDGQIEHNTKPMSFTKCTNQLLH